MRSKFVVSDSLNIFVRQFTTSATFGCNTRIAHALVLICHQIQQKLLSEAFRRGWKRETFNEQFLFLCAHSYNPSFSNVSLIFRISYETKDLFGLPITLKLFRTHFVWPKKRGTLYFWTSPWFRSFRFYFRLSRSRCRFALYVSEWKTLSPVCRLPELLKKVFQPVRRNATLKSRDC